MGSPLPTRVLVVTDKASLTPELADAIRQRAARGPAEFRILVPNPAPAEWHPGHPERRDKVDEAKVVLAEALPRVAEAAGSEVAGLVSIRHDPMDAIGAALLDEPSDEIILAMPPHPIQGWLHVDLPHRLGHLGLPISTVTNEVQSAHEV